MPNGRGGDLEEEGGGASRKRPRPGLSVQDARISVEAHSPGVEESRSVLEPVSISFAMKCNASTLGGRTTALEAALRKVATDFGGLAFRLERTRVGPSDDTLQRGVEAGDGNARVLPQSALRRLDAFSPGGLSTDASTLPAEHAVRLHASNAFLQRWRNGFQLRSAGCVVDGGLAGCNGSLHEWLQAASQEPDASFLSRGAASTADMLGLPLLRWAAKPQGRYRGVRTLSLHSECVRSVAFSPDGNWIVSGSGDRLIKIWTAATGAEVRQ
ncbi:hypothetical protein T484DRAFT_1848830 [Baffinella frigidus]|nr:hypothetical protein T484DRAFT_1848830 [Cryptophyta sp. CCMP2293]